MFLLLPIYACNDSEFISSGGDNNSPKSNTADHQGGEDGGLVGDDFFGKGSDADSSAINVDGNVEVVALTPKFGLMINSAQCSFCHTQVHGDVASTRDVSSASVASQSRAEVIGAWYGVGSIGLKDVTNATGGFHEFHTGSDGGHALRLPTFDKDFIAEHANGRLIAAGVDVNGKHNGNLVVNGRDSQPFQIKGDVLIDGDLVILGRFSGRGNIYVTGHIYIPFDIIAQNSPFPFPSNEEAARTHARNAMGANNDSLGLAAEGAILIADLGHQLGNWYTGNRGGDWIYSYGKNYDAQLNVRRVYSWFSGGQSAYENLYGNAWNCVDNSANATGSFNRIDAMLFSPKMVGGIARRSVYTINGGVITDNLHIVTRRGNLPYSHRGKTASACRGNVNPVSGQPTDANRINYDFRIREGLPLLRLLKP